MINYTGLDRPKKAGYFLFWKVVFIAVCLFGIGFVYAAADFVDYNWRWGQVPQYFWLNKNLEVRAEAEGDLTKIDKTAAGYTVIIQDGSYEEVLKLPADTKFFMAVGDYVYMGDTIAEYRVSKPGLLLEATYVTLKVSILAIVLGIVVGILTGLMRISENPCLRWLSITYVELIRGSPLLVQIFLWYFVAGSLINAMLDKAGLGPIPALWYGVFALAIFTGAYVAEIVRAGVQSVHRGQAEAARALGLTNAQAMRKVILPQAFRRILPPLAGQFISLIKDSSLLGVIAVRELTKATREVISSSLMSYELWIACTIMYLVLTFALSVAVQYLERRAVR
ncbi:MAG: amino acid ABC transporter permease [Desulfovibrionales bacterium]|nr:amino acid ABC transporter permease [Desulfovibrionales bacterium]